MISLIVALSNNHVIGRDGDLPWHLSEDLRRFKKLTMGHTIVMGRKTYESIGRALPGRTSVIITRQTDFLTTADVTTTLSPASDSTKVKTASTLETVLAISTTDEEIFVIGGAQIYELALPHADRLYLTRIHANIEGDTYFPEIDWEEWACVEDSGVQTSFSIPFPYSFQLFQKAQNKPA